MVTSVTLALFGGVDSAGYCLGGIILVTLVCLLVVVLAAALWFVFLSVLFMCNLGSCSGNMMAYP